jgi:hypothetical protein
MFSCHASYCRSEAAASLVFFIDGHVQIDRIPCSWRSVLRKVFGCVFFFLRVLLKFISLLMATSRSIEVAKVHNLALGLAEQSLSFLAALCTPCLSSPMVFPQR